MSFFASVEKSPKDPILGLESAYTRDTRTRKVNLGIGAYRNDEGRPQVLSCVRKAEKMVIERHLDKEYLPIPGLQEYTSVSAALIFGEDASAAYPIAGVQTLGGTGALRIGGEFLAHHHISDTIYLPDPTWPNHPRVFTYAGLNCKTYPYFDKKTHALNFSSMCAAIMEMPAESTILLQGSCHNPTGRDPNLEQWKEIGTLLKKKRIIPFFDLAYQGFGCGLDKDAEAVRFFAKEGYEMFVACSYSKNFGLYGERVGLLFLLCKDGEAAIRCGSRIHQLIRGNYSTPPLHGQRIVTTILQSKELSEEWQNELSSMRERVNHMRDALADGLAAKEKSGDYTFLKQQKGIFSYSLLSSDQVLRLRDKYGIYLPSNGRINIAGLNQDNLAYTIDAIASVRS